MVIYIHDNTATSLEFHVSKVHLASTPIINMYRLHWKNKRDADMKRKRKRMKGAGRVRGHNKQELNYLIWVQEINILVQSKKKLVFVLAVNTSSPFASQY